MTKYTRSLQRSTVDASEVLPKADFDSSYLDTLKRALTISGDFELPLWVTTLQPADFHPLNNQFLASLSLFCEKCLQKNCFSLPLTLTRIALMLMKIMMTNNLGV